MQSKWPNSVSIKAKNKNFDVIENFTGFGKTCLQYHEYYYSWNKNSIIFSKIAQTVRGHCHSHYIIALHMYNMRKLLIKSLNSILILQNLSLTKNKTILGATYILKISVFW